MYIGRLARRALVAVVFAALATAASAQVVIRERVEVPATPRQAASSEVSTAADDCSLPTVGVIVYRGTNGNSTMWSSPFSRGGSLQGTLSVETTCGGASGQISNGFYEYRVEDDSWPTRKYTYWPEYDGEIFRIPLRSLEEVTGGHISVPGAGFEDDFDPGATGWLGHFGCIQPYNSPGCDATEGMAIRGGAFGVSGRIYGWGLERRLAWPDTVDCGTTTPLPMLAVRPNGDEGYVAPGTTANYRITSDDWGWLTTSSTTVGPDTMLTVGYAEARAGGVSFVAPPCESMGNSKPHQSVSFRVGGATDGPGHDGWELAYIKVLPPPVVELKLIASQDTILANTSQRNAAIRAIAKRADGRTGYLDPATDIQFSVSAGAARGKFRMESGAGENPQTLPYYLTGAWRNARQDGALYRPNATPPVCDTRVTVTASGGGVFGETSLMVEGTGPTTVGRDTLVVGASPDSLTLGERATVTAMVLDGGGCPALGFDPDTPMEVLLAEGTHGELEYDGQRGVALTVPYSELKAGAVEFLAADSLSGSVCPTARIGVFGGGLSGETSITIRQSVEGGLAAAPEGNRVKEGDIPSELSIEGSPTCEAPVCPVGSPDWDVLRRAQALAEALQGNPYGLLDVPCDQLPAWKDVASHTPPGSVLDRIDQRANNEPWWKGCKWSWGIQDLADAAGANVNLDYYAIRINLPGERSPEVFFEEIRRGLGSYLDRNLGSFYIYEGDDDRWRNGQVLGSVGVFEVSIPYAGNIEDVGVVASEYSPGPNAWRWRFTTIWSPDTFGHAVSGTREFGLVPNGDGSYTFYTRGVDRIARFYDVIANKLLPPYFEETNVTFNGADALWRSMQIKVLDRVVEIGGDAEIIQPISERINWDDMELYFNGEIELDDIMSLINCD